MKLSLVVLLIFVQDIQADSLNEVLDNFKTTFDVRTILVFAFNVTAEDWREAAHLECWPKVVITDATAPQLRTSWGDSLLSFVFVDHMEVSYLDDVVKPSLINLHLRDIVFYTKASLTSADSWLWLFEWCWQKGFWHVLLTNDQQQFLTMDSIPGLKMKATTFPAYLEKRQRRNSNLQGYPLKVTLGNNPPRVQAFFNSSGHLQFSGVYGHAMKIFAAQFNATLEFVIMPNMSAYSLLSCIDYIKRQETDVCSDVVSYQDGIVTTRSSALHYGRLLVPYDTPLEIYHYFLKPYRAGVWSIILVAFIGLVMLLTLVEWVEQRHLELSLNFLTAFQSFIYIPFSVKHVHPNYRYGLETLLLFCGFALSSCYLAFLSSILLTKIYHTDISSFYDVIERNRSILINKYDVFIWNNFGAPQEINRLTVVVDDSLMIDNRRNLNTEHILWALDDKSDFYLYQQKYMLKPRMKKLDNEVVIAILGGMPMRSYWPFEDLLTDFMDNLLSSGIMQHITVVAYEEGIAFGQITFFATELVTVEPLTMEYFQVCAIILLAGYCMSLLCFVMEIIVYKKFKGTK